MTKLILIAGGVLFLVGCKSTSNPKVNTSASLPYKEQTNHSDSIHSYNREIQSGSKILKVQSRYVQDTVNNGGNIVLRTIITDQKLVFLSNTHIVKQLSYPVDSLIDTLSNNKSVLILENAVRQIGVINKNGDTIFAVYGGGQQSQSEFYGLYTVDGNLLAYSYANGNKVIGRYGDFTKTLKRYHIPDSVFYDFKYPNVSLVLPDKSSH